MEGVGDRLRREAGGQGEANSTGREPALLIRVKDNHTVPAGLLAYSQGGSIQWPASLLMKCK